MLARVYGLKNEVSIFLESQGKQDLLLPFQSQEFQLAMAYLVDIFEALNFSIYCCKERTPTV